MKATCRLKHALNYYNLVIFIPGNKIIWLTIALTRVEAAIRSKTGIVVSCTSFCLWFVNVTKAIESEKDWSYGSSWPKPKIQSRDSLKADRQRWIILGYLLRHKVSHSYLQILGKQWHPLFIVWEFTHLTVVSTIGSNYYFFVYPCIFQSTRQKCRVPEKTSVVWTETSTRFCFLFQKKRVRSHKAHHTRES